MVGRLMNATAIPVDELIGQLLGAADGILADTAAAGLIISHENFLHRDIAPDNIIVRADGSPVLLDFGAARRAVAEMSRTMTGIVKAGYSPHEQIFVR